MSEILESEKVNDVEFPEASRLLLLLLLGGNDNGDAASAPRIDDNEDILDRFPGIPPARPKLSLFTKEFWETVGNGGGCGNDVII